jgi:hypothetical protein
LIGTNNDRAIGRKVGESTGVVQHKRTEFGIPGTIRRWTEDDDSWLSADTDSAVARALGRIEAAVTVRRKKPGIRAYRDE